jgi:hypothetical protein
VLVVHGNGCSNLLYEVKNHDLSSLEHEVKTIPPRLLHGGVAFGEPFSQFSYRNINGGFSTIDPFNMTYGVHVRYFCDNLVVCSSGVKVYLVSLGLVRGDICFAELGYQQLPRISGPSNVDDMKTCVCIRMMSHIPDLVLPHRVLRSPSTTPY